MVKNNARITVSCKIESYPQSVINWERINAASEVFNITTNSTTQHNVGDTYYTTSTSSLTFTANDIDGFSKFCCTACCTAHNRIGNNTKCLIFTETGKPYAICVCACVLV